MLSIFSSSNETMMVDFKDIKWLRIKEHEGHYFIKMEFIKGNTDYLSVKDKDEALAIIRDVGLKNSSFMLFGDENDEALNKEFISVIKIIGEQILVTFKDNNTASCLTDRKTQDIMNNICVKE